MSTQTCPGKIFILGEYTSMQGGPAILIPTTKKFKLHARKTESAFSLPFADASPAGKLLHAHLGALKGWALDFEDPYDTPIGVGSSSAQFLLSYRFLKREYSLDQLLHAYWETVGESQGLRPSGYDVLLQELNTPCFLKLEGERVHSEKLVPLPESRYKFALAFTGSKAKTHEHLLTLKERGFPGAFSGLFAKLDELINDARAAWKSENFLQLGSALNAYQEELARAQIAPQDFHQKVLSIQNWSGVVGAKGSGAQGGDCVLILMERAREEEIAKKLAREFSWKSLQV